MRSLTTCSYVSDATSFAMRHCTIVVTPLPMFPEPDSFRPREIHHRPNASCLGNEKKSPCRWWLIDGCKSLFNVKPSTVPTRLIPELYAHTRTAHPERFLRAEKSRRPNTRGFGPYLCFRRLSATPKTQNTGRRRKQQNTKTQNTDQTLREKHKNTVFS